LARQGKGAALPLYYSWCSLTLLSAIIEID